MRARVEPARAALVDRGEGYRPPPDARHVTEDALGALGVEAAPVTFVIVDQAQASVDGHLGGGDAGRAEVEPWSEDRFAHGVDVARYDLDRAVRGRFVDEKIQLLGQLGVEIIAHEAEVVLFGADSARGRKATLLDDLLPHRETEMIRIDRQGERAARRVRAHHVGVSLDRGQVDVLRQEVGFAQQSGVPIGGPALVHDLTGEYRIEVERLLAYGEKNVSLPAFELR